MDHTFRARGLGRFFLAAFLLVWLAGWSVAEWFAVRFLVWAATGAAPEHLAGWMIVTFVLFWTAGWTAGGWFAAAELFRLIGGVDHLRITPDGWTVRRGVGPFARTTHVPRSQFRDVFLRPGGTLVIDSTTGDVVVTSYGNREEKRAIVQRFSDRDAALDELPARWTSRPERGGVCLGRKSPESPGCLVLIASIALLSLMIAIRFSAEIPRWAILIAAAIGIVLAALAVWAVFSRREIEARRDHIATVVRFLAWRRETVLDNGSLVVTETADSDGDHWFALGGTSRGRKITLFHEVNDERTALRLARRIEKASGWSISISHITWAG